MPSDVSVIRFLANNAPSAKPEFWSTLPFCLFRKINQKVRRRNRVKTVSLSSGARLNIDLSTQIGQAIDLYRCWEYPLTQLLRSLIKPNMIFFDVGANIGYYSVLAASLGGTVHAFEPVPKIYADLEQNASLNKNLKIESHPFALSDFTGDALFYVVEGSNSGLSSLVAWSGGRETTVPVRTLDKFCEEQQLSKVDVMKVDVEGAEEKVFEGAKALLSTKNAPDIVFEFLPGTSADNILREYNYRIYELRNQRSYEAPNLFATKRQLSTTVASHLRPA